MVFVVIITVVIGIIIPPVSLRGVLAAGLAILLLLFGLNLLLGSVKPTPFGLGSFVAVLTGLGGR